jgi:hypothetical protein
MINEHDDRSFEEKAIDFLSDLNSDKGYITIRRDIGHDVYGLKVGTGKNTGLVYKDGDVSHAQTASHIHDKLVGHFNERGYEPWSYELVKPNYIAVGERKGIIQEYFDAPSLSELHFYHVMMKEMRKKERGLKRPLNAEETEKLRGRYFRNEDFILRCERLLGQTNNADITPEQMREVVKEFDYDKEYLGLWLKPSNVIVLGQRKGEDLDKTALAIIDF